MKSSSMFLLLSYHYNYVMKLELSSYVIHLAYRTLCLIFHTYMFRQDLNWGSEFYFKISFGHYILVGSSSIPMADALVEDSW